VTEQTRVAHQPTLPTERVAAGCWDQNLLIKTVEGFAGVGSARRPVGVGGLASERVSGIRAPGNLDRGMVHLIGVVVVRVAVLTV
jgi:hypothetical protein